jgi:hypothetical protein
VPTAAAEARLVVGLAVVTVKNYQALSREKEQDSLQGLAGKSVQAEPQGLTIGLLAEAPRDREASPDQVLVDWGDSERASPEYQPTERCCTPLAPARGMLQGGASNPPVRAR